MTELSIDRGDVVIRGTATGTGPTALLLHAGGETRRVWAPVATRLATHDVRTVAYDLRGHGGTGGEATTLAQHATDVADLIRRQPPPVTAVGASLGGLAAVAALADPAVAGRVRQLVLVDVVPDPDPVRSRAWLAPRGLIDGRRELVDDILRRGPDLLAVAAALTMPLLLVRGGTASPLAHEDVARLLAVRPDARVVSVPDAGHLVARDAPIALADVLAEALVDEGDPADRAALELVRELGAEAVAHPGGTLDAHLHRVWAQVRWWGASPRVRWAAACHAAYGTDGFPHALLPIEDRARLAAIIGPDAEALVHVYGACDRARTYARLGPDPLSVADRFTGGTITVGGDDLRDLAVLTIANELDVARFAPLSEATVADLRALIAALAAHAPVEAADALGDPALA